jgi:uncharacterized protein
MEYRRLGKTGFEISVIGFGSIGARGAEAAREMLVEGKRMGINYVDTARSNGRSDAPTVVNVWSAAPMTSPFPI